MSEIKKTSFTTPALFDADRMSVRAPWTPDGRVAAGGKGNDSVTFVNFNYDTNWFQLRVRGKVGDPPYEDRWGNITFDFEPDVNVVEDLGRIENLFRSAPTATSNRLCAEMGYDDHDLFNACVPHGLARSLLYQTSISLKLKPKKGDPAQWGFKNGRPAQFAPGKLDGLKEGDTIVVDLYPGVYVNGEKGTYGWYVTVAGIDWDAVAPIKKVAGTFSLCRTRPRGYTQNKPRVFI